MFAQQSRMGVLMRGGKKPVIPNIGGKHHSASPGAAFIVNKLGAVQNINRIILGRQHKGPRRRIIKAVAYDGKIVLEVTEGGWSQDITVTTVSPEEIYDFVQSKFKEFECSYQIG